MRKSLCTMFIIVTLMLPLLSCHKKKPLSPDPQAFAVSLDYRVYHWDAYCLRLFVDRYPISQCGLGLHSEPVREGDYTCRLCTVINEGQPNETTTFIASSPLHLDRNFTCVIDSYEVYWEYWGK